MELKIETININGLRSKQKQTFIKDYISTNKINILCIQETHVDNYKMSKQIETLISKEYFYVWNFSNNLSCGCCIIVNDTNIKCSKFQIDFDGRFISLDIQYLNDYFKICNIYAPNKPGDRNIFFESIKHYLVSSNKLIILGDFNFILNPLLDKIGGTFIDTIKGCKVFKQIVETFKLTDIYRQLNPDKVITTWGRKCLTESISCRLDRIYIEKSLIEQCKNVDIIPCPFSDHDFVSLTINLENNNTTNSINIGKSYWKLNNSIFEDEDFVSAFEYYFKIISRTENITLEWWDILKTQIKDFCIDYSKSKNKKSFDEIKKLVKQYKHCINILEKNRY